MNGPMCRRSPVCSLSARSKPGPTRVTWHLDKHAIKLTGSSSPPPPPPPPPPPQARGVYKVGLHASSTRGPSPRGPARSSADAEMSCATALALYSQQSQRS